ncbi:thioredoxin [Paenibacillus sp. LMG 31456]|uniref:Thioredoxin n=1 Tax=Paenibacillus foliorum TaxID=2654974 RepID=A0A972K0F6_9BACL|nr:thioredoxin family protein [Paenibacillus foliorum]NOU93790.1 thioredoxin [Paenibacillus foliorum]
MTEWSESQLKEWALKGTAERKFFYFYTPLCGTCKMTERMLQVILALDPQLPIVKCNINFCPQISREWQIESVPCIAGMGEDGIIRKRYRMQAVDDLHRWFQEFA